MGRKVAVVEDSDCMGGERLMRLSRLSRAESVSTERGGVTREWMYLLGLIRPLQLVEQYPDDLMARRT